MIMLREVTSLQFGPLPLGVLLRISSKSAVAYEIEKFLGKVKFQITETHH
jgi:hypothetical protein